MSVKIIRLEINCGENTCASEPGKFCVFLRTNKFGTLYYCQIFHAKDNRGQPIALEEKDSWLLRCLACKLAERNKYETESLRGMRIG